MAGLNTQLGYQTPRNKGVYAMPQAPRRPTSGVTRALAAIQPPARPSFADPYANPGDTIFQQPALPAVQSQAPGGPSTYTAQTPQAPAPPAGYSFDLETDPILQQMHAMAAKQRSEADASALAQRKDLAIQYGDQSYGNSIDQNTGQAAAQNPFSVTANLAHQYQTGTHNLDEQLNQHNLFYSGARINELANALRDYQQQQATAAGSFQQALGNVNQNRVAGLMGADQSEQGAYNDAYTRALQLALATGMGTPPAAAQPQPQLYASAPGALAHTGSPTGPPVLEHAAGIPITYGAAAPEPTRSLSSATPQQQVPLSLLRQLRGIG